MSERRYIASLDGLRTLAVLAVIAYHVGLPWAQGGLLGVTVFFVLSGYLITGLLVSELEQSGTVKLGRFWLRRVRRLFPAIACVVAATCVLCGLFNHVLLTKLRPDLLPSLLWMQNWWYIFRDLSYFENLGAPSPLVHFWSLAIEEQFYLVWPLCLLGLYKLGGKKASVRRVCLGLAVVSAVLMAVLYDPQGDPTRVYYGTDTRAFSLLLGGWLSLVWQGKPLAAKKGEVSLRDVVPAVEQSSPRAAGPVSHADVLDFMDALQESRKAEEPAALKRVALPPVFWDVVGWASLVGLLVMMALVDGVSPFMYYGGLVLASVLTMLMIAALVQEDTLLARAFALKPLVWMGQRSYGMYLWHFPLILLLDPLDVGKQAGIHSWWFALLVVVLVTAVAAVQYRWVEDPIRRGGIGALFKLDAAERLKALPKVTSAVCGVMLVAAVAVVIAVPEQTVVPEEVLVNTGAGVDQAIDVSTLSQLSQGGDAGQGAPDGVGAGADITTEAAVEDDGPAKAPGVKHQDGVLNPVLIGDSVPAAVYTNARYPISLNDSVVGRSTGQGLEVLQQYLDEGVVGHVVIFACFSNHRLQEGELDRLYEMVGPDRELFLITSVTPNAYSWQNNDDLWVFAHTRSNVRVIDWVAEADGSEDRYLWGDNIHLRPEGQAAYLDLISENINYYVPEDDINRL